MTALQTVLPPMVVGLFDDAAIFPPGNLPLDRAVPAHLRHRTGAHRELVGPFVVAAAQLADLGVLLTGRPQASFDVAVTVPSPHQVSAALAAVDAIAAARLVALEVAVTEEIPADAVAPALAVVLGARTDVDVFVELPRDARRTRLVEELSHTPYLAKLRTGGVRADLYPDAVELGSAIVTCVRAGLPFKATAGLHHALRNTDGETGFEQHGFLNVINAVDAAVRGADHEYVVELLAERDPVVVSQRAFAARDRMPVVRSWFRSFGTCSIHEPLEELVALGLVDLPTEPSEGDPS